MTSCRYFLIKNQLSGNILEVGDMSVSTGVPLSLGKKSDYIKDSQLFRQDDMTGTLRSKLSDMCVDIYGKATCIYFV